MEGRLASRPPACTARERGQCDGARGQRRGAAHKGTNGRSSSRGGMCANGAQSSSRGQLAVQKRGLLHCKVGERQAHGCGPRGRAQHGRLCILWPRVLVELQAPWDRAQALVASAGIATHRKCRWHASQGQRDPANDHLVFAQFPHFDARPHRECGWLAPRVLNNAAMCGAHAQQVLPNGRGRAPQKRVRCLRWSLAGPGSRVPPRYRRGVP